MQSTEGLYKSDVGEGLECGFAFCRELQGARRAGGAGGGADRAGPGQYGNMPLHKATSNGHLEVAEKLLAAGADMGAKSIVRDPGGAVRGRTGGLAHAGGRAWQNGKTPLDVAIEHDKPAVVAMLREVSVRARGQLLGRCRAAGAAGEGYARARRRWLAARG